jgi:large subunit ribosomal protein L9
MAVEVLLVTTVEGLGAEGEVVRVADGYARNYLFPRKLAAPVTEATRRRLARVQQQRADKLREEAAGARRLAESLANASCTLAVKVGAGEKLFGSVTNADIAEALKAQGLEVDRHAITLDAPIKELGVYEVAVKLHPDVEATVKVWVVEE